MMFNNSGNMGCCSPCSRSGVIRVLPAAMMLFLVENIAALHLLWQRDPDRHVNSLRLLRLLMLIATLAGLAVA